MMIEKIVKMKNNKYKLIINSEAIITYDNVIIDNNLLYKKDLTKEEYNKLLKDSLYYEVYDKTIKYIMKHRRSKKEIIEYLLKYDLSEIDKDKILKKLESINLINDRDYARAYINDKLYLSKCGINKIRIDLLNQDIDDSIIEEELNNIDKTIFDSRLEKLVINKIHSNKKHSNYQLKQKLLNEMINLGYNKNRVLELIESNMQSDLDNLVNEYNKLLKRLEGKYTGNELNLKLKQKLLSKGFTIDNINEVIKK